MPEAELIPPTKTVQNSGQFQKGHVKAGGRDKGVTNKLTVTVKEAIAQAFDEVGGVDYLKQVATDDPKTFCTLLGKLLPLQIANSDDEQLVVTISYERLNDADNKD